MSDFINKVVTIILIFVLLIIAPLANTYVSDYSMAKREILNDTSSFIDKVTDDKTITKDDLNKFYAQCNSHGLAVNVTVTRMIRSVVPDSTSSTSGATTTVYYASVVSSDTTFKANDIIKVEIQEVGVSTARRVIYSISRFDDGQFKLSLAGEVK